MVQGTSGTNGPAADARPHRKKEVCARDRRTEMAYESQVGAKSRDSERVERGVEKH